MVPLFALFFLVYHEGCLSSGWPEDQKAWHKRLSQYLPIIGMQSVGHCAWSMALIMCGMATRKSLKGSLESGMTELASFSEIAGVSVVFPFSSLVKL